MYDYRYSDGYQASLSESLNDQLQTVVSPTITEYYNQYTEIHLWQLSLIESISRHLKQLEFGRKEKKRMHMWAFSQHYDASGKFIK